METRRMCPHCRAFITTRDRVCPYCHEKVGPRAAELRDPGAILGGIIPHGRFITMLILLVNAGLYLATGLYSMNSGNGDLMNIDGRTLAEFGGKLPIAILHYGQWWRLVTAGFLHGGLMHIGMNSWVMFSMGQQVEEIYGATRMIVIYFCATVLGFLASTLWSASLSIGASAGIMGMAGAMIALGMRHRSALGDAIKQTYVRWVILMFLIGLLPMFRVDNAAHLGGLAGGFGAAWLAGQPRVASHPAEKIWRAVAIICVTLTAVSFFEMYLWFSSVPQ